MEDEQEKKRKREREKGEETLSTVSIYVGPQYQRSQVFIEYPELKLCQPESHDGTTHHLLDFLYLHNYLGWM